MGDSTIDELVSLGANHTNDDIAAAARGLSLYALKRLRYNLEHGTPAFQQRILSTYIPALVKAATGDDEDAGNSAMRAELEAMGAGFIEALGDGVPMMGELGGPQVDV